MAAPSFFDEQVLIDRLFQQGILAGFHSLPLEKVLQRAE